MIASFFSKYWQHFVVLFLGLLLAFVFKPSFFEKYKGKLVSEQGKLLAEGQKVFYADLDGDGLSEEYTYYHLSDSKQPVINKNNAKGEFEHTWYLDGKVVESFDFLSGDYNSDAQKELYVFSVCNEGLHLYAIDGNQSNLFLVNKALIASEINANDGRQIIIRSAGLYDLNNDGMKEVLFSVSNRYKNVPRRLFAFDIENDTVISSAELGLQLVGRPNVVDIDNDGNYEIFLSTLNSLNFTSSVGAVPNLRVETIVLDNKLQLKYPKYTYTAKMSVSSTLPFVSPNFQGHVSLNWTLSESKEAKLALFSKDGVLIKEVWLDKQSYVFDQSRNNWGDIVTFSKRGKIEQYNQNLQLIKTINVGDRIYQVSYLDLDNDDVQEALIVKENSLLIYQADFSTWVEVYIPGLGAQKLLFSVEQVEEGNNRLSIQNQIYQYKVSYYKNPYYHLVYLYYTSIGLFFLGLFIFIRHLYKMHIEYLRKSIRESTYMHIDLVKNQLDPHFLFNALNSIAFSVNKDDKNTAYRNIGIFSKFLREAIVSIDDYGRTLEDEINFIKYYLELEKFRFKEKFEYDIIISPKVPRTVKIPKMCVFSYVESALKKGVLPKDTAGTIEIGVDVTVKNVLIIRIIDDGLHRSLEYEKGNTKSMVVMERSIKFYNQLNAFPINISYTDKGTKEEPKGSIVELQIPMDFNYDNQ